MQSIDVTAPDGLDLVTYCGDAGSTLKLLRYVSSTNIVTVTMETDQSHTYRGFLATYSLKPGDQSWSSWL